MHLLSSAISPSVFTEWRTTGSMIVPITPICEDEYWALVSLKHSQPYIPCLRTPEQLLERKYDHSETTVSGLEGLKGNPAELAG